MCIEFSQQVEDMSKGLTLSNQVDWKIFRFGSSFTFLWLNVSGELKVTEWLFTSIHCDHHSSDMKIHPILWFWGLVLVFLDLDVVQAEKNYMYYTEIVGIFKYELVITCSVQLKGPRKKLKSKLTYLEWSVWTVAMPFTLFFFQLQMKSQTKDKIVKIKSF